MDLADYTTLTFDCYGTLIDWESGLLNELRPWAARHRLELDDEAILAAFSEAESMHQSAAPGRLYPAVLADVLRDLGLRWGCGASAEERAAFGASVGRWPAFPDSAAALAYLKAHYKLVILSNVDRASFAKSNEKLGVAFDAVITAEDVGSYKPNPRNFETMLETLAGMGVAKAEILHVAQSLFHDIAPARAIGLPTVWVNRRKGRPSGGATPPPRGDATPDLEVATMAELADLHRAREGR